MNTLKGRIKGNRLHIFWDFSGPYGPIRTHMTGPGPYEGETLQEKRIVLFTCLSKNVAFDTHTIVFESLNSFFIFLTEIRFRSMMKLPQNASFGTKAISFGTSVTLPNGQPHHPARLGNSTGKQGDHPAYGPSPCHQQQSGQ